MPNPVTAEERARIVGMLREPMSATRAAKQSGRSRPTVCKIAAEEGIELNSSGTKKAREAKADWDQARRVGLLGKGMEHAEKMLPSISEARDLQSWFVSVATGVDKLRLEAGEATSREEKLNGSARDRARAKLGKVVPIGDRRAS